MTRIDFYVLADGRADDELLGCRIAEKAWHGGHRVLLAVEDANQAERLDRLLWTFREQTFIPHGLNGSADATMNPVLIDCSGEPGDEHDVLINLSAGVPTYFSRFDRVAECIGGDEASRAAGRERFRYYRDHGYPLTKHDIT